MNFEIISQVSEIIKEKELEIEELIKKAKEQKRDIIHEQLKIDAEIYTTDETSKVISTYPTLVNDYVNTKVTINLKTQELKKIMDFADFLSNGPDVQTGYIQGITKIFKDNGCDEFIL